VPCTACRSRLLSEDGDIVDTSVISSFSRSIQANALNGCDRRGLLFAIGRILPPRASCTTSGSRNDRPGMFSTTEKYDLA
jgi:hypothetical protein